jgi:hypothetical protein
MSEQRRGPASDLERWAAARAPDLLARAEADAIAVLRDALVAASVGAIDGARAKAPDLARTQASHSVRAPAPDPTPEPPAPVSTVPDETRDLLWAYCVLRDTDASAGRAHGVGAAPVERVAAEGLAALVSRVPAAEFAQEPLTRNLNDLTWLERVARAHEAVLDETLAQRTIVPLRMCTIFESEDGVREMLVRRREPLTEALDGLEGRLEWAVKVLVDGDRLIDAAGSLSSERAPAARTGEGGAYLQRRRDERGTRAAASRLAAETAQQIHARLQDWALDAHTAPPQNRELSGHEGEMVLNASYLIERERTEELRQIVAELEEHHRGLGARIELSGPWPPYNFVPGPDATAMT